MAAVDRSIRLKAFMEEYARIVQLFEDIGIMKESMLRLEIYMIIMVCQVAFAALLGGIFLLYKACTGARQSGQYRLEHRFEREGEPRASGKGRATVAVEKKSLG